MNILTYELYNAPAYFFINSIILYFTVSALVFVAMLIFDQEGYLDVEEVPVWLTLWPLMIIWWLVHINIKSLKFIHKKYKKKNMDRY